MPEYTIHTDDIFITTLVDKWMTSKDEVDQIDEDMNIESLGKTKLLNAQYLAANPDTKGAKDKPTNELAVTIRQYIEDNGVDDAKFVGLFVTLTRLINEYNDRVEEFVKANIVEVKDEDKPSETQMEEWRKNRKKIVDAMNGIRNLLESSAPDWFQDEGLKLLGPDKIENLRGAPGNREKMGERLGATFTFLVTDEEGTTTALKDKNLSALKDFIGAESVADVRKLIEESNQGFVWKTPPDTFSFKFGKFTVNATKNVDDSPEEKGAEPDLGVDEGPDIIMDADTSQPTASTEVFDDDDPE